MQRKMQNAKCKMYWWEKINSEQSSLCSIKSIHVVDNTATDGFWRTTSKLFLLHLSLHMFLMAPIMMVDGRSCGDDIGGAGDDVYSENIECRCVS